MASTPTCRSGSARRSRARRRGPRPRGRLSDARAGRRHQPARAWHRAAGLARGGAAPARRLVAGGALRARHRSSSRVDDAPDGVRATLATMAATPHRPSPVPPRRRRRPQPDPRPARRRDARMRRAPTAEPRSCSAPAVGLLGGLRYALYVVSPPGAPGLFLPAGSGRPVDLRAERARGRGAGPRSGAPSPRLIRAGSRRRRRPAIERIGPFHSPGQLAERFCVGRTFLVGDAAHRVTPRVAPG